MDDNTGIYIFLGAILLGGGLIGFSIRGNININKPLNKLQEATTSAQIKSVCKEYESTIYKETPIKCLREFELEIKKGE